MKSLLCAMAVAALLCGCSRELHAKEVGFAFEPPKTMKLRSEVKGPPAIATFENGLEIRSVTGTLPGLAAGELLPVLAQVKQEAKLELPQTVSSLKGGSIPAGPVARFELKDERTHALLYVVQGEGRYLTVLLTAPKREFDARVNLLERAMSSLQFR